MVFGKVSVVGLSDATGVETETTLKTTVVEL
jgi:hypothetical protein